jgi:hypothetical protein
MSSSSRLCFCTKFAVGVTNGQERERAPKSPVKCACVNVSLNVFVHPVGGLPSPFISQREGSGYREREREREIPGIVPPLLPFAWAPLAL